MRINIARQPLVPAFLTLLVFTVAAMCCAQGFENGTAGTEGNEVFGGTYHGIETAGDRTDVFPPGPATDNPLALPLPGVWLATFQSAYPIWSRLIAGFLILFAGMCTGRLTVRYNLYTVGTCIAIPLYALLACPVAGRTAFLPAFAASALWALAIKNFSRSFCNGYAFDPLFRASLYLGLLPFVTPGALPLALLLPLALTLFRRTGREAVVAATGALFPALTLCYLEWGAGGGFFAPLAAVWTRYATGAPFRLFQTLPAADSAFLAGCGLLTLLAVFFFLSDFYAAGTKPRFILIFNLCAWILTLFVLAGPAAAGGDTALAAVPSAVLLPVLFVRIHRVPALVLYLAWCVFALALLVLQYSI